VWGATPGHGGWQWQAPRSVRRGPRFGAAVTDQEQAVLLPLRFGANRDCGLLPRRLKLSSLASSGADPGGLAARKLSRRRHRLFFPEQQVGSMQLSFCAVVSPSPAAQPSAGTTRSQEEQGAADVL